MRGVERENFEDNLLRVDLFEERFASPLFMVRVLQGLSLTKSYKLQAYDGLARASAAGRSLASPTSRFRRWLLL